MFLIIKLALRNLRRHLNKSILLGTLIMVGIAILFLANSIFLGTNSGMEKTFVGSFTGDAAISMKTGSAVSLFGNEIPIVSNLETIPPLLEHDATVESIAFLKSINSFTSIVSVTTGISIGGINKAAGLFGIDPDSYFTVCPAIDIVKGSAEQLAEKGVLINSILAGEFEQLLGRPLELGEPVTFTLYSNNSFRIRTVPLAGIHQYPGETEALNRVVLADLTTVRSMASYTLGYSALDSGNMKSGSNEDLFSFDDLFSQDSDLSHTSEDIFNLQDFENQFADTEERDSLVATDKGAYSFILLKAVDGKRREMIRNLKKNLDENKTEVDILSWRQAAGSTALMVLALQSVFYLGLGFLGIGAVLVIMNALVFSVLERTGEIGTMRSIGAPPRFISSLFMMESLIITIFGAVLGIVIGTVGVFIIQNAHLQIHNNLLVSLFGGSSVNPVITFSSIFSHLFIALSIGGLAWIYPVSLAMKIQPVSAMNRG